MRYRAPRNGVAGAEAPRQIAVGGLELRGEDRPRNGVPSPRGLVPARRLIGSSVRDPGEAGNTLSLAMAVVVGHAAGCRVLWAIDCLLQARSVVRGCPPKGRFHQWRRRPQRAIRGRPAQRPAEAPLEHGSLAAASGAFGEGFADF